MEETVNKISKTQNLLFHLLFFFTPLILWPKTSEVFEFNKMLFVYLITILISTLWFAKWFLNKKISFTRTKLDLPLFLFLLFQILSTIFSIHPRTSLWGYYSRFHGGLASSLSYLLLYYALVDLLSSSKEKTKTVLDFINTLLISSLLVSLYGILEHFGIDKNLWVQDVQNRVFSTLGQPNWLSAYLIALLPLPLYLSLKKPSSWLPSFIYPISSLLIFIVILFTKSRSGIGTTAIILFIFFASQILKLKQTRHLIWPLFLSFLALTLIIGTPWSPNPSQVTKKINNGGPLWPEIEPVLNKISLTTQVKPLDINKLPRQTQDIINKRAQGELVGGSDSFDIRSVVWQGALQLGKKYPLLGPGPETFGYTYFTVRPIEHNFLSEWEFLYNKAHNEYLNFFATTGFLGLFSYLFLILATLYFFASFLKTKQNLNLTLPLGLGYLSILITNFFGFSVVPVALLFFLYPALSFINHKNFITSKTFTLKFDPSIPLTVIIIFSAYLLLSLANTFKADLLYNQGKALTQAQNIKTSLPLLEKAVKLQPQQELFTAQLGETEALAALAVHQQLTSLATPSAQITAQGETLRDSYLKKALDHSQQALNLNPHHTNLYKSKAKTELYLSVIDPQYTQKALNTLLQLASLAPTDPKTIYNIGLIYQQLNQKDKAKQAFEKSLELKPDFEPARHQLDKL